MAIIHYGKSVFTGNARTRRHRRRQPLSRLKQSIDQALNYEPETFPYGAPSKSVSVRLPRALSAQSPRRVHKPRKPLLSIIAACHMSISTP